MYVDGAHNEKAWLMLKESLNKYFTNDKFVYIIGVLKDKEYSQRDYPFAYFKGSPAAENALRLEYGVIGKGKWYIPSKEELKMVFFNNWLDEINKCYLTMGLPVLRYGYYWSSIAKKGSLSYAWYVGQGYYDGADWDVNAKGSQYGVLACASFIL